MKESRLRQGTLTLENDLTKSAEAERTISSIIDGLNHLEYEGLARIIAADFRWMENYGCCTKHGLREFQENWVRLSRAAFTDKVRINEARIVQGEWVAAFGAHCATHSGEFMDVATTDRRVEIRHMDFWKVADGQIVGNWVMVDFADVLRRLDRDPFNGHGWERFDAQSALAGAAADKAETRW